MKNLAALNGAAAALAIAMSTCAVWVLQSATTRTAETRSSGVVPAASFQPAAFVDHSGAAIPRRDYRRIASASTVADAVLLEISEPDRVVACSAHSARSGLESYRFRGRPTIEQLTDIEHILSLHPDLVLVSAIADPRPASRLREAGLVVYDLGDMRGMSTLIPNIHEIAELLEHPERGDRFARAVVDQMSAVAADVPKFERPRALYLSVYGGILFGGARGTSYLDVLLASGLADAAPAYRDWPQYTAEQLVMIDPDVIVTNTGMRPRICEHAGLAALKACLDPERIVEIDGALMGDAGPLMVEAARAVKTATHGSPKLLQLTMKGTNHD